MAKLTGKTLAKKYGIECSHALYRERGDWYHVLKKFPAALFDSSGYVLFKSKIDYDAFVLEGANSGVKQSIENNWLTIKDGIGLQPGYVLFNQFFFAEEFVGSSSYVEGALQKISVNRFERDHRARRDCIEHWGCACAICGFNFMEIYGDKGRDFIHVHHLTPLSSIRSDYLLDPKQDLRPVCPNCHAMIHRTEPPSSIEALKALIISIAATNTAKSPHTPPG